MYICSSPILFPLISITHWTPNFSYADDSIHLHPAISDSSVPHQPHWTNLVMCYKELKFLVLFYLLINSPSTVSLPINSSSNAFIMSFPIASVQSSMFTEQPNKTSQIRWLEQCLHFIVLKNPVIFILEATWHRQIPESDETFRGNKAKVHVCRKNTNCVQFRFLPRKLSSMIPHISRGCVDATCLLQNVKIFLKVINR